MGRRHEKFKQMFRFLRARHQRQEPFALEELAEATGYKMSSIRTYHGKRLKGLLVRARDDGRYEAHDVDAFDEASFIDYMTQRSSPADLIRARGGDDDDEGPEGPDAEGAMIEALLGRSAAYLRRGLELYHRDEAGAGLGACCTLLRQSWDLLLKAELALIRGLEPLSAGEDPGRALRFEEMLRRFFPDPLDPTRRNLEWIARLDGECAYLLVPELAPHLSRLLEAGAVGLTRRWEAVAGRRLFTRGAGALALGVDGPGCDLEELERRYGAVVAERLEALLEELHRDELVLQSEAFATEPARRLVLADPSGQHEPTPLAERRATRRAHRRRDPAAPYPFALPEALHQINQRLPQARRLTPAALEAIDRAHDIRAGGPSTYHLRVQESQTQEPRHFYSRAYVDWVVASILEDPSWLERARSAD